MADTGLCVPVILGSSREIESAAKEAGVSRDRIETVDPEISSENERYAEEFARIRAHKGVTLEEARETVKDVLFTVQ